jgi:hypothetical protein
LKVKGFHAKRGYSRQKAAILRPHQSPAVTAVPLFVTYGDISPRRGENLSLPGEAIIRKGDFTVKRAAAQNVQRLCEKMFL